MSDKEKYMDCSEESFSWISDEVFNDNWKSQRSILREMFSKYLEDNNVPGYDPEKHKRHLSVSQQDKCYTGKQISSLKGIIPDEPGEREKEAEKIVLFCGRFNKKNQLCEYIAFKVKDFAINSKDKDKDEDEDEDENEKPWKITKENPERYLYRQEKDDDEIKARWHKVNNES